jgi:hypothetical protein
MMPLACVSRVISMLLLKPVSPAVPLAEASKADSPAIAARVLCEKGRIELSLGKLEEAQASAKAALGFV